VQRFSALAAESQLGSLALAVFALLLPAVFFHLARVSHHEELAWPLSLGVSVVLLMVYGAALVFSLRTHRHLLGGGHPQSAPSWSTRRAVIVLLVSGAATGIVSEVLVGSVEHVGNTLGLGPSFLGVVVIAILGNAAEHAAAVFLAWKNEMDAAISVCYASSLQVALFVTRFSCFSRCPSVTPMTLVFSGIEVIAVAVAVALAGLVTLNGESKLARGRSAPRPVRDPRGLSGTPADRRGSSPILVVTGHRWLPDVIISGGQTGVDRGALDAAARLGIAHGGWCPRGRRAEDGEIPERYRLRETPSRRYAQRTAWNVRDSDATLVLIEGDLAGGTALTVRLARTWASLCRRRRERQECRPGRTLGACAAGGESPQRRGPARIQAAGNWGQGSDLPPRPPRGDRRLDLYRGEALCSGLVDDLCGQNTGSPVTLSTTDA